MKENTGQGQNQEERTRSKHSTDGVSKEGKKRFQGKFRKHQTQFKSESEDSDEEISASVSSAREKKLSVKKGRQESFSRTRFTLGERLKDARKYKRDKEYKRASEGA